MALHREAGDFPDFEEWLAGIKPLLNSYKNQDIHNCDETALFWRMTNGKSFIAAHEMDVAGDNSCCVLHGRRETAFPLHRHRFKPAVARGPREEG